LGVDLCFFFIRLLFDFSGTLDLLDTLATLGVSSDSSPRSPVDDDFLLLGAIGVVTWLMSTSSSLQPEISSAKTLSTQHQRSYDVVVLFDEIRT
jgi:hypothetical protein